MERLLRVLRMRKVILAELDEEAFFGILELIQGYCQTLGAVRVERGRLYDAVRQAVEADLGTNLTLQLFCAALDCLDETGKVSLGWEKGPTVQFLPN